MTVFGSGGGLIIPMLVDRWQLSIARKQLQDIRALKHGCVRNVEWTKPLTAPALVLSLMLLVIFVAILYFVAAALCVTLPAAPPNRGEAPAGGAIGEAEQAMASMAGDLRRIASSVTAAATGNQLPWPSAPRSSASWASSARLPGTCSVDGEGLAVLLLPLGWLVIGILLLNAYGRLFPHRRASRRPHV